MKYISLLRVKYVDEWYHILLTISRRNPFGPLIVEALRK